jgi:protein-disulfide isomerase
MASPVIDQVVSENKDVRLVFKNYPLDVHQNSEQAARAALAADLQGKFWEMHKALFELEMPPTEPVLFKLAVDLGLDEAKFKSDMRSEAVADRVARDRKQGEAVKLRATPTIYVNGRSFEYGSDMKQGFTEWLSLERKLLGKTAAKQPSASPKAAP